MAQQGSGLGKGPDPAMQDQTSFNARNGAAKNPQTSFPVHPGMKDPDGSDETNEAVGPVNPGSGPDASSPNPLDPTKVGKRVDTSFDASWGATDGHGKGVDKSIGGKVLGEAILSGSAKLPDSESYGNAKPVRQPG